MTTETTDPLMESVVEATTTQSAEVIRFSVGLPPRGLRRNRETVKHAWRSKLKDQYSEAVWIAGSPFQWWRNGSERDVWKKAHLRLVWKHAGVAPDEDNALASLKVLIDVLHTKGRRPLGIIQNDSPDCLSVELRTEKVAKRVDEGVDVEIERITEQRYEAHAHGPLSHEHFMRGEHDHR